MGEIVNMREARSRLSKLVSRANTGEEIVIAKAGRPVARLVQLAATPRKRRLGTAVGEVWIADDFDDPTSGFST